MNKIAIGDVFRLKAVWQRTTDGPTAINQFVFKQGGVLILDTPEEDLVAAFREECETQYVNLVTNTIALVKYEVSQSPLFLTSLVDDIDDVGGALTGDALPARIAGLIGFRTADLSRRGRGRYFLPPPNESSNTAGAPSVGYISNVQGFADNLFVDMNTVTITHTNWILQLWSPTDTEAKEVTQINARGRWATQRDRGKLY